MIHHIERFRLLIGNDMAAISAKLSIGSARVVGRGKMVNVHISARRSRGYRKHIRKMKAALA